MSNSSSHMIAQMIVRQSPILRHTPFPEDADSNVSMPGARHSAVQSLKNTRQPGTPAFCRIKMLSQFSMLRQISKAT